MPRMSWGLFSFLQLPWWRIGRPGALSWLPSAQLVEQPGSFQLCPLAASPALTVGIHVTPQ